MNDHHTQFNFRFILAIIILSSSMLAINVSYSKDQPNRSLPKHKAVPGGIAILPLDTKSVSLPVVYFNNKRILVIKYNNISSQHNNNHSSWLAILGIPMNTPPGLHKVSIFLDQKDQNNFTKNIEKTFMVAKPKYPTERLKLSPKLVSPSLADQLRINKENELIRNAYNYWSHQIPNLTLQQPIIGRKSSPFGLNRILNGMHKGFHSGLDLAAPAGTKIYASASGKVILTGNFFYTGHSIFIDHGQGLITSYSHLDTINVAEGDPVDTQTIVGTVGSTGRSTGPHLHWAVSLNDARVNPELFSTVRSGS